RLGRHHRHELADGIVLVRGAPALRVAGLDEIAVPAVAVGLVGGHAVVALADPLGLAGAHRPVRGRRERAPAAEAALRIERARDAAAAGEAALDLAAEQVAPV